MVAGGVPTRPAATRSGRTTRPPGTVLWSTAVGTIHWQSPVVTAGIILLEDGAGHLTAWSRPGT